MSQVISRDGTVIDYDEAGSMEQKKKDQAIATLDAALKELTADGPMAKRIASSKTQYALIDSMSPALDAEKMYGEYKGIEALKGKVVILDFFAHWCGPCIRSFPDMKALYDANKDKGLEMIGVTTYYGYYKDENREKHFVHVTKSATPLSGQRQWRAGDEV